MSSLIDKLEAQALSQVEQHGSNWIEKALGPARDSVAAMDPSGELSAIKSLGELGLNKLEANKARFADLGYQRTLAFLGRAAMGQTDAAARILSSYGGGLGGWGEADAIVANAGDVVEKAKRDQDEAIAFVKEFGATAAKSLLPILLTAVKL